MHYLHLLPLVEMWHFLWALSIIFLALITTVLGSCWNRVVGLATVEDLSQRVEATELKILYLMKLSSCVLWSHAMPSTALSTVPESGALTTALPLTSLCDCEQASGAPRASEFLNSKDRLEKTNLKSPPALTRGDFKTSTVFWPLMYLFQKSSSASRTESLSCFPK